MCNGRQTVNSSGLISVLVFQRIARLAALFALFFASLTVFGQTTLPGNRTHPCASPELKPGLVVESVARNSEAAKAGLEEDDIILSWYRGDTKGEIESPFDLSDTETEQEPRGRVTLEGTRASEKQTWVLGPDKWGIQVRPNLTGSLLKTYRRGQELASAGRLTEAAAKWRLAAAIGTDQCSWLGTWLLSHAAEALADARKWKEADEFYQESIRAPQTEDSTIKARLLQGWAATFRIRRDWQNAQKYLSQAMTIRQREVPDSFLTTSILRDLSIIVSWGGYDTKATEYLRQALTTDEKLAPDSLIVAHDLNSLASWAWFSGDLDGAEKYYRQALTIKEKLVPDSLDLALTLGGLGDVASQRGDQARTTEYYHRALTIGESLDPGGPGVGLSFLNLGNVAEERGEAAEAEKYFQRALATTTKPSADASENWLQYKVELGSLSGLMNISEDRGDLEKEKQYEFRMNQVGRFGTPAANLVNLGEAAEDRGDLRAAEKYLRQALALSRKLGPDSFWVGQSLATLCYFANRHGDLAESERDGLEALALFSGTAPNVRMSASLLLTLADIARKRGNLVKAGEYYHQALAISSSHFFPDEILSHLGDLSRQGDSLEKAEEYYRQALEIRKKLAPQSESYAKSLAALAGVARDRQQADEALRLYAQAIEVLDSQLAVLGGSRDVRAGFRAKHADYYSQYADLLLTEKQPDLAFQVLERSRARTLLEMLTEANVEIRQGVKASLLEQERALRVKLTAKSNRKISLLEGKHTEEQFVAINKGIDELLSQYREVEGQIRTSSPSYAALTQPLPLSAKDVQQQLLDANTVLLEYSLGEKRSFVFVLTQTSLDSYELPKRSEIEDSAHHVYELVTSRNRYIQGETISQRKERVAKSEVGYQKAFAKLSQMILCPIAEWLAGKRLLIVADGALQYIPFAALPAPAGDTTKRAVPLVAEHEVINLPSASVLALLRRQAKDRVRGTKAVAVLADPVFDKDDPRVGKAAKNKPAKESASAREAIPSISKPLTRSLGDIGLGTRTVGSALPRLAFSRREADDIMAMTDAGSGMESLDFKASRETAVSKDLGQYRIVHFATHGLLDNKRPELSGLVLSMVDPQGNPQDGFLDLEDVYNLTLPADLVVLSACETGLGKQITGEGLVGLTRGFMYAGTTRVVASMWKVDDVATTELMGRFYRGMLKEGLRPAAALRQAQMEMQKQKRWTDPYYWAAFTFQGEWK